MGTALTIRELVGERTIFRREQAVGLSTTAYLLAKIWVYSTAAMIQWAILVAIVVYGKGAPTQGAVVVGNASVELFLNVAGTSVTAAILGLALSALARSNEQIMPMLVVLVISQLVFGGGMIPVAHRLVLRPAVLVHAGPVGLCRVGLDGGPDQAGPQAAGAQRFVLASHPEGVDLRHGHAERAERLLRHVRSLEDPAQGRVGQLLCRRVPAGRSLRRLVECDEHGWARHDRISRRRSADIALQMVMESVTR